MYLIFFIFYLLGMIVDVIVNKIILKRREHIILYKQLNYLEDREILKI